MQTFTKTIYVASAKTQFSKISETIYMAKHIIYGGAPLYAFPDTWDAMECNIDWYTTISVVIQR